MSEALIPWLEQISQRLTGVEGRLGAVERALGFAAPPGVREEAHAPLEPPPVPQMPLERPMTPPPAEAEISLTLSPAQALVQAAKQDASFEAAAAGGPKQRHIPAFEESGGTQATLEALIGRNWTSWIGAIVVVLGMLFFVKYAWDQGWLALSPLARVISTIVIGITMGGVGEWLGRKQMRVLAGTLVGAGVAIVMGAFLAAHSLFDPPVFSSKVATAGVGAAAVVGIFMALRMNVMSLAVVALLGAYIAPMIVRSGRDESAMLLLYLGALAVVGWSLAYLKPRWEALRWFLLGATTLWMAAWMGAYPLRGEHRPMALMAVAFFFAGFLAEIFFSLHRALRIRSEADASFAPGFVIHIENVLALFSMLITALTFLAYYGLLYLTGGTKGGYFHMDPTAGIAIGLACVHAMLAMATPSRQFARSSLIQAAALVTLAVPLTFGEVAITIAWLVLAGALAGLSWRRDYRAVRIWSVVLLGLALLRLFTLDLLDSRLGQAIFMVGEQPVSRWLIIAFIAGIAAQAMAWLFESGMSRTASAASALVHADGIRWGAILSSLGTSVCFFAAAICWHGTGLTLLWIVLIVCLAAAAYAPAAGRFLYAYQAAVVLVITVLRWLAIDGLQGVVEHWSEPVVGRLPVLNLVSLEGALLMALTMVVVRRRNEELRQAAVLLIAVMGFAWLNFETLRAVDCLAGSLADVATAKVVALSVLWAIIGLAAVLIGFARQLTVLRYAALSLLAVTLVKILFVDLAEVRPVYRILSFLAVGAMLLCVSFVYHRHSQAQRQT